MALPPACDEVTVKSYPSGPVRCRAVRGSRGVNLFVAGACPAQTEVFRLLSGLRDSERGRGMRFTPSSFGKLLEPIQRRQFDTLVKRHAGDAYVKSFPSWNHLLALVYAQFAAAVSLRGRRADQRSRSGDARSLA